MQPRLDDGTVLHTVRLEVRVQLRRSLIRVSAAREQSRDGEARSGTLFHRSFHILDSLGGALIPADRDQAERRRKAFSAS
jgi:hypothetical protein